MDTAAGSKRKKAAAQPYFSFFDETAPVASPAQAKRARHSAAASERAVQFISLIDGQYVVQQDAIDFLTDLDGPLAIIAVAGKYRTGKSFLMNHVLLDLPAGAAGSFGVGPSIQPCTKGLWLYTRAIPCVDPTSGQACRALIIDTEGIGATQNTDDTHDTRIFALAMLLASYFVYNSRGVIDEDALSSMSLVVNISKSITVSSSKQHQKRGTETDLSSYMPHFLWVVRDFALQLVDEQQQPMSEAAYLESALREAGDAALPKNNLRRTIKQYFHKRDCVTLVRPTESEEHLQDITPAVMRPKFKEQAAGLRARVLSSAPMKTMCGRPATGRMIVQLAQAYADAINRGAAPAIKDTWSLVSESHCRDAAAAALSLFVEPARLTEPCSTEALMHSLSKMRADALTAFDASAFGDRADASKHELVLKLDGMHADILDKHTAALHAAADAAAATIDDALDQVKDFGELKTRVLKLRTEFSAHVHDSKAAMQTWDARVLPKHVFSWAARFYASIETRMACARADLVEAQRDLDAERASAKAASEAAAAERTAARERAAALSQDKAGLEAALEAAVAGKAAAEERARRAADDLAHANSEAQADAAAAASAEASHAQLLLSEAEAERDRLREEVRRVRDECALLETQYAQDAEEVRAEAMRALEDMGKAREEDKRGLAAAAEEAAAAAASALKATADKLAACEKKYDIAHERSSSAMAALKEELEKAREEARAAAAARDKDLKSQQEQWRKDMEKNHAAAMAEAEAHATARLTWSEKAAGTEAKLRYAEAALAEAAQKEAAAAEATARARSLEAELRAAQLEAAKMSTEVKHAREAKLSMQRQSEELRDTVQTLERKCKDIERTKDLEITKLRMRAYNS